VALLVVLVAVTLLAIMVMEFHTNSLTKLSVAANTRDEVVAYYNAKSGINLMHLALYFQYELREAEGVIGRAVTQSNFQLWRYLDLFLPTFVTARVESPVGTLDLEQTGAVGFGEWYGDIMFHDPVPEEGKINLNDFSAEMLDLESLVELCALLAPEQYDPLFGPSEDPDLELPTRGEVIGAIVDYIDPDSDMLTVDESCQPIDSGMGAEDRRYQDFDYGSKNEPLTTLDELLLVAGVTPEIYQTFEENLTVYAVADRFYVNLADSKAFMGFLCANIDGARELQVNPCRNPMIAVQVAFLAVSLEGWVAFFSDPFLLLDYYLGLSTGQSQRQVEEGIAAGQMIAFRTPEDFMRVLRLFMADTETAIQYAMLADPRRAALFGYLASGGESLVPPALAVSFNEPAMQAQISVDTPRVFTISATGIYGSSTRTITAVVDYSQDGRFLYWREY
jgi:hypothetical protein